MLKKLLIIVILSILIVLCVFGFFYFSTFSQKSLIDTTLNATDETSPQNTVSNNIVKPSKDVFTPSKDNNHSEQTKSIYQRKGKSNCR